MRVLACLRGVPAHLPCRAATPCRPPARPQASSEIGDDVQLNALMSKVALLCLHFPRLRLIWSRSLHATADIFQQLKANQEEPDPITGKPAGKGVHVRPHACTHACLKPAKTLASQAARGAGQRAAWRTQAPLRMFDTPGVAQVMLPWPHPSLCSGASAALSHNGFPV